MAVSTGTDQHRMKPYDCTYYQYQRKEGIQNATPYKAPSQTIHCDGNTEHVQADNACYTQTQGKSLPVAYGGR